MRTTLTFVAAVATAQFCGAVDLVPATFEDLGLGTDSHWIGDVEDEDYFMGTFRSGSFEFNNLYWADYATWAFFGYASHVDSGFSGDIVGEQWNCAAGHGHGSDTYGILYHAGWMGPSVVTIPDYEESGVTVPGMWICNTAWVADAILNGDGQSGPFERWDAMMLSVWGVHADGSESLAEMLLADYTLDDEGDWYAVNDWQYMDLSCLGDVVSMRFEIDSTKASDWGVTTPTYVCIDDLGATLGTGVDNESVSDCYRVSVHGDEAVVSGVDREFMVIAVSADGRSGREVAAIDGRARVGLSGKGVNLLHVVSAEGSGVIKVMSR